jgi:alpha-1,2-mannosyltransferase
LVSRGPAPNLYAQAHYEKPKQGSPLGVFDQDDYFYPPPFLLLPRALLAISDDFVRVRAAWFFLESLVVFAALWFAARRSGAASTAALLGAPLVFASVPMLATLQVGNFQAMALALSVLALVAVLQRRDALGGALLAFAAVSKIFPGILIIYLLARRRWAAVAWCAAFAGVYVALALWVLGPQPFSAFLDYMLPRLSSGEAFGMLEQPAAIALNHSIAGMVLKLRLLNVAHTSVAQAASAAWIYTIVLVPIAFFAGRRLMRDSAGRDELLLGLALLHLGALRSPFTPDPYATIARSGSPYCSSPSRAASGVAPRC